MTRPEYSDEEDETSIRHRIDEAGNVAQGFVAEHSQVKTAFAVLRSSKRGQKLVPA